MISKNELEKTIKHFDKRIKFCQNVPNKLRKEIEQIERKKTEIPNTIKGLKQWMKERNISGYSNLRKAELQTKAINHIDQKIGNIEYKINQSIPSYIERYKENKKLIQRVIDQGIPERFNEQTKKINEKRIPPKAPIDYESLGSQWDMDKTDAIKLRDALKKHEGQVCVLHGGGGWSSEAVYLKDVDLVSSMIRDAPKNKANVKAELYKFTKDIPSDYCGKTGSFGKGLNVEQFNPFIKSWKLDCFDLK